MDVNSYPKNYSYCSQNPNPSIIDPLDCQVQDGTFVYQPVDQTAAMFITTRFSQTVEKYVCNDLGPDEGCDIPWVTSMANGSQYDGTEYYVQTKSLIFISQVSNSKLNHFWIIN